MLKKLLASPDRYAARGIVHTEQVGASLQRSHVAPVCVLMHRQVLDCQHRLAGVCMCACMRACLRAGIFCICGSKRARLREGESACACVCARMSAQPFVQPSVVYCTSSEACKQLMHK